MSISDTDNPFLSAELLSHDGGVLSLCFSKDKTRMCSVGDDQTVKIWDLEEVEKKVKENTGEKIQFVKCFKNFYGSHRSWIRTVDYSPDGNMIATGSHDRLVKLWDPEKGYKDVSFKHENEVYCVTFFPEGNRILSNDKKLKIWDLETSKLLDEFEGDDVNKGFSCSYTNKDGKYIVGGHSEGKIKIWDRRSYDVVREFTEASGCLISSIRINNFYVAHGNVKGEVCVHDLRRNEELHRYKTHNFSVRGLSFHPKFRNYLLSASDEGNCGVFDFNKKRALCTLETPETEIHPKGSFNCIEFSRDGRFFGTGNDASQLLLWSCGSYLQRSTEDFELGRKDEEERWSYLLEKINTSDEEGEIENNNGLEAMRLSVVGLHPISYILVQEKENLMSRRKKGGRRKGPKKNNKKKIKGNNKSIPDAIEEDMSTNDGEFYERLKSLDCVALFANSVIELEGKEGVDEDEGEIGSFCEHEFYQLLKKCFLENLKVMLDYRVCRDDKFPLSRMKKNDKASQFMINYIRNSLECQKGPYYDEVADEIDKKEYYKGVEFTYEGLNHLLSSTYVHGNRRIGLWAWVDRQPDGTVKCAYNNSLLETKECLRQGKCDEEHLVPQSWHKGSKTHPGQDMHQIYIVSKSANGSRGNRIFGEIGDGTKTSKVGGHVFKKGGTIRFCPYINVGAVCRATLYTLVAYKDTFHEEYFPKDSMDWIIRKAETEPVTVWEKHRNRELFKLQQNRNPFIDFPDLCSKLEYSNGFRKK